MMSLSRLGVVWGLWVLSTSVGSAQMITAHRGASYDAPENTMVAFQLAWQQGADAIEGDFYLTADQQIVCIHDKDTQRTAGVKLDVQSSDFEALRDLDVGSWKSPKYSDQRMPLFRDVLATVPKDKVFVIELKSDERIVQPLVSELADAPEALRRRLLIISFSSSTIRRCKEAMPDIRAHWLTSFKKDNAGNIPTASSIAKVVQDCSADGVGMQGERSIIDTEFIQSLTRSGCREFHVWTVDDANDAQHFRSLGAIGITTNRPAFIRQALASHPSAGNSASSLAPHASGD